MTGKSEALYPRFTRCLFLCLILTMPAVMESSGASSVEHFQRFVSGEQPIKKATIYRSIEGPDERIINEDWLRFAYETETWYAQRLKPKTNHTSELTARESDTVAGSSYDHIWTYSDGNIHIADKRFAANSGPKTSSSMENNCMRLSISLGIPHLKLSDITWNGLKFQTRAVTKRDEEGDPISTNEIPGELVIGTNGLPNEAHFSGVGTFGGGQVHYKYSGENQSLPTSFTVRFNNSPERSYHYEYRNLKLGEFEFRQEPGYVPSMFAPSNASPTVTLWTNDLPYTLAERGETVPAFKTSRPRHGALIFFIVLSLVVPGVLAFWYYRSK